MAWMSDEEYTLMQDTRDKKITARSARHTRTHCGKGGRVKFPSDYLTKKERDAMNGEVKSYRMNEPMTWKEFREMPEDLQKEYIKSIRKKYNISDKALSQALGVCPQTFCKHIRGLGIALGRSAAGKVRGWDESEDAVAFNTWWYNAEPVRDCAEPVRDCAEPVKTEELHNDELIAVNDDPEIKKYIEEDIETVAEVAQERQAQKNTVKRWRDIQNAIEYAVPESGEMSFEGEIGSILRNVFRILEGQNVRLTVKWDVLEKEEVYIQQEPINEELVKKMRECAKTASYALLNEERRKATGSKG